jgi:hypothetical protein
MVIKAGICADAFDSSSLHPGIWADIFRYVELFQSCFLFQTMAALGSILSGCPMIATNIRRAHHGRSKPLVLFSGKYSKSYTQASLLFPGVSEALGTICRSLSNHV